MPTWATFFTTLSALGIVSCADRLSIAQPSNAATVTRTAPLFFPPPPSGPAEPEAPQRKITRIPLGTFYELQQKPESVLIFDVRPGFVYRLGHVPGAISWPKGRFEEALAIHEPQIEAAKAAGKPVILYCTDLACPDAHTVANRLASRNHSVAVLEGGWAAWKEGGLPVE